MARKYIEILEKIEHLRELNKKRDLILLELEYTILNEQAKVDFKDVRPFKWKMMARYEKLRELRSKGSFDVAR